MAGFYDVSRHKSRKQNNHDLVAHREVKKVLCINSQMLASCELAIRIFEAAYLGTTY